MKDNQHEQLFTELTGIAGVEELSNETAAAIQGGWDLEVYRDYNLKDRVGSFNVRSPQVKANNQISSVKINAGVWRFYDLPNYRGNFLDLGPGTHNLVGFTNDGISSLKQIA